MKSSSFSHSDGNAQIVIIVGLFVIAVLLGVLLLWQKDELNGISHRLDQMNVKQMMSKDPSTVQKDCQDSGGAYAAKNGCSCATDFHIEEGYCVDAMGTFGGKMGDQMHTNMELRMRQAY